MNKFLFLFLTIFFVRCNPSNASVVGFNIRDTDDKQKVMLDIIYDNRGTDTIILDRKDILDHNKIWKVIEQILNERHIDETIN